MIDKNIIKQERAPQVQENNQNASAVVLTPQLFMFRQYIIDILNHCKKNIKSSPFDQMQVDRIVQSNSTKSIDVYQQYFLAGIGYAKTRELVCNRYERLIRENLINKDNLPPQMITGIINARTLIPSGGGSTASSGSNSVVGSGLNINIQKSLEVGKLVSAILSYTIQPSSQINAGLVFLLQGTRSKSNGGAFTQLLEDVYSSLQKFRIKPIDRFIKHFITNIVNQIQYHQSPYFQHEKTYIKQISTKKYGGMNKKLGKYNQVPQIMSQKGQQMSSKIPDPPPVYQFIKADTNSQLSKQRLCIHPKQQDAKFGKCFICQRPAPNYDKSLFVPLCSIQCKNKLKRINQQCLMNDHFSFFQWLIENLVLNVSNPGSGDQIIYSLLIKQIAEISSITDQQIGNIMIAIVNNFSLQAVKIYSSSILELPASIGSTQNKIIQNSAMIISLLIRRFPSIMLKNEVRNQEVMKKQGQKNNINQQQSCKITPNFQNTKIIILQMIRLLESLPIINNSLQITLMKSLVQILSVRRQAQSQLQFNLIQQLYIKCDCKVMESNVVQRILNIVSQYALINAGQKGSTNSISTQSTQSLGTNLNLGLDSSSSVTSLGMYNSNSVSSACNEAAISSLQQMLTSIVKTVNSFDRLQNAQNSHNLIIQKKAKKYIQNKFVEQFNRKPVKAVDSLRKIFKNISPKEIALIIRQNMEYQTKVKKINDKINKQQVGSYFGTAKKDKNQKQDIKKSIYLAFLQLLSPQFEGRQMDDCLRITFNTFKLPKEGQQVDEVLAPLSLILQPFLGFKQGNDATVTYQIIMTCLMVQTSTNPNVKQGEKLKYEDFKKYCLQFDKDLPQSRISQIYERIKSKPLERVMQYKGQQVFTKKYLKSSELQTEFWKHVQDVQLLQQNVQNNKLSNSTQKQKSEKSLQEKQKKQQNQQSKNNETSQKQQKMQQIQQVQNFVDQSGQKSLQQQKDKMKNQYISSKNSIQLQQSRIVQNQTKQSLMGFIFQNLWQFIYMSLVNRSNLRGIQQSCIIYGKCQLMSQFQAFFNYLYKIYSQLSQKSSNSLQNLGNQAKLIILKLSIDYPNFVIGRQSWLNILKIIYKYDSQNIIKGKSQPRKTQSMYTLYEYETSDKIFTRTNIFNSYRLKQFLQAMCQFSSSQVKTDKSYTRQIYILRHITQIIQYNLQRFEICIESTGECLWKIVWPTIRSYFKDICIHPRQQISMSAIDSYKQLTMKILKLHALSGGSPVDHNDLIAVYLHVFERSPSKIKDLIINVLLNVVSKQIRSGWNQIYNILDVPDSGDRLVVMKVINRIINDVGLSNAGNIIRIHQIILKQLRISSQQNIANISSCLWEVCSYLNRLDVWLQTMSKIKDIYKSTSYVAVLYFMYKVSNQCLYILNQNNQNIRNIQKPLQIQNAQKIQNQLQKNYLYQAQQQNYEQKIQPIVVLSPQKAFNLIYFEIFSAQMHILQIKNTKLFIDSLAAFKQLNLQVLWRNLGSDSSGTTGFLVLWDMFLSSSNSINFCSFLHEYMPIVFKQLSAIQTSLKSRIPRNTNNKTYIKSTYIFINIKRQIIIWLLRLFIESSKDQVLQLSQQDTDLNKSFTEVVQNQSSNPIKTQLIQFYLSSKDYEIKSTQHLILMKIIKIIYQNQNNDSEPTGMDQKILQALIDSYQAAVSVNSKPLLRYFLWNNQFFKSQDYLPGLIKQELRSIQIIIQFFSLCDKKGKVCKLIINFIKRFYEKSLILYQKYSKNTSKKQVSQLKQPINPNKPSTEQANLEATNRLIQALYQDLGLWVTNSQQIIVLALKKLSQQVKVFNNHPYLPYQQLLVTCTDICRIISSQPVLDQCSTLMSQLINKIY